MEILKAILDIIKSFFDTKKEAQQVEAKVEDAKETAVVEKIRATENAKSIEIKEAADKSVENIKVQQKTEYQADMDDLTSGKKTQEELDDEQFGSD